MSAFSLSDCVCIVSFAVLQRNVGPMHFTTKQTVSIDKEGGVTLPDHIFNEVQPVSHLWHSISVYSLYIWSLYMCSPINTAAN